MRSSTLPIALIFTTLTAACGGPAPGEEPENDHEVIQCDLTNCPEAAVLCLSVERVELAPVTVTDRPGITNIASEVDDEGFDQTGQPACYPFRTPTVVMVNWGEVEDFNAPNDFDVVLEPGEEHYLTGRYGLPPPAPDDPDS